MAHKIKLLILDIDGVLTDGTKIYDINHKTIYKKFQDKDFTAIKRLKAAGIKVIFLSGDNWNKGLAKKRVIDFYLSRGLYADKEKYLPYFNLVCVKYLNSFKSIFMFLSSKLHKIKQKYYI